MTESHKLQTMSRNVLTADTSTVTTSTAMDVMYRCTLMATCHLLIGPLPTASTISYHPISPPVTLPSMQPQSVAPSPIDYLSRAHLGNMHS